MVLVVILYTGLVWNVIPVEDTLAGCEDKLPKIATAARNHASKLGMNPSELLVQCAPVGDVVMRSSA